MSGSRENLVRVSLPSNSALLILEVSPQMCSLQASQVSGICAYTEGIKKTQLPFSTQFRAYLVAQLVKNRPAMQETWVRSLGWEDPLEKGKAIQSSILAQRIPWIVHGAAKSWTRPRDFHFHFHHSHGHIASIYTTRRAVRVKEVMVNITS